MYSFLARIPGVKQSILLDTPIIAGVAAGCGRPSLPTRLSVLGGARSANKMGAKKGAVLSLLSQGKGKWSI